MEITVQEFKHCDMITVKGRVDSSTAPQLAQALESANDFAGFNQMLYPIFGLVFQLSQ